ncbi:MAG TPA: phosphotransferase [Actinomycetes bacterium]|nr:phosphotransferase [Actinomycetes bacterium]
MTTESLPAALDALFDRISVLRGRQRTVSELSGGLTNKNYRVQTDDGGDYVVRVSEASTGLLAINRDNERFNTRAAADAGVGAPVIEALPDAGVLVVGFLKGRTLTAADIGDHTTLPRVAAAVRQLHRGPAFQGRFDMRTIRRYYLSVVLERGYQLPDDYLLLEPQVELLEDAMQIAAEPLVPCNNDLLAANFIDDDERIWLIDYEYSGMNEASFELGNMASESFLDVPTTQLLVSSYWECDSVHMLARARAWSLLARYGWTLWASIQASASPIDFDFWAWGMQKYDSALAELRGPEYDRILQGLRATDWPDPHRTAQ